MPSVSQTVMDLLAALTDNLKVTFPALLIANIITSVLSNKPTNLQIALGNLTRESKSLINPVQRYQGPNIVPMPDNCSKKSVPLLTVLCSAILSERRAKELDIAFLRDVTNNEARPEYNGYNTMMTRQQGVSMQPKTKAVYLPLIDMFVFIRPRHNNDGSSQGKGTNQRTRPEECHFHKQPTTI